MLKKITDLVHLDAFLGLNLSMSFVLCRPHDLRTVEGLLLVMLHENHAVIPVNTYA